METVEYVHAKNSNVAEKVETGFCNLDKKKKHASLQWVSMRVKAYHTSVLLTATTKSI